jgi:hypothetical protein
MQPCAAQLCTLRPELVNLEFADQVAMVLACRIADAAAFFKCSAKQAAEAAWIEKHTGPAQ